MAYFPVIYVKLRSCHDLLTLETALFSPPVMLACCHCHRTTGSPILSYLITRCGTINGNGQARYVTIYHYDHGC